MSIIFLSYYFDLNHFSSLSCSAFGCPYSTLNINKEWVLQDRLGVSQRGGGHPGGADPHAPISVSIKASRAAGLIGASLSPSDIK